MFAFFFFPFATAIVDYLSYMNCSPWETYWWWSFVY